MTKKTSVTRSNWTYQGNPIDEPVEGAVGFIYVITNVGTGRKYIGQKTFYSKVTKPPLKGQTKKRRSVKESDWRSYWGSSDELKLDILKLGEESFTREIIIPCESKTLMNYEETRLQFTYDVLRKPDEYYNGIINCRINRKQLMGNGGVATLKKVARQKALPISSK